MVLAEISAFTGKKVKLVFMTSTRKLFTSIGRRIVVGSLAVTTALGIGAGAAMAAPAIPALPGIPGLPESPALQLPNIPGLPDLSQLPGFPSRQEPAPAPAPEPAPAPRPEPKPASPCPPTARACVDLANNKSWLQENGHITFGPVPISSGKPGYETTKGSLSVTRKVRDEWSVPYNGPMPFAVYFTNTGEAFHEGSVDVPSHGCIHLDHDAAVKYFDTLQVGDNVFIW